MRSFRTRTSAEVAEVGFTAAILVDFEVAEVGPPSAPNGLPALQAVRTTSEPRSILCGSPRQLSLAIPAIVRGEVDRRRKWKLARQRRSHRSGLKIAIHCLVAALTTSSRKSWLLLLE